MSPSPLHRREDQVQVPKAVARDESSLGQGDLGRRVAYRRKELGLSQAEVERRAHLAPGHLRYLETSPEATLGVAALHRLASALDTTASELRGEHADHPPGFRTPRNRTTYTSLSPADCERLVGDRGIGRFVFDSERGPVALPVNYLMVDGDVVFRTASDTSIDRVDPESAVGFEVDAIDDAMGNGWSVLFTGNVQRVEAPADIRRLEALGLDPWAGGQRDVLLRLVPVERSGRRIRSDL